MNFKQNKINQEDISNTLRKQYRLKIDKPEFIELQNRYQLNTGKNARIFCPVGRFGDTSKIRIRYNRADWELTYNIIMDKVLSLDQAFLKITQILFDDSNTYPLIKRNTTDKLLVIPATARDSLSWGVFQKI